MRDRVFLLVAYFVYRLRDSLRLRLTIDERRNEQRNHNRMTKYRQPIDVKSRIAVKSGKPRGFTLVELLVVMAIIAMLTGILLPALYATRRIAYKTLCKENLHGCAIAFRMYLDDNKNIMPSIIYFPSSPTDDEISYKAKPLSVVPFPIQILSIPMACAAMPTATVKVACAFAANPMATEL